MRGTESSLESNNLRKAEFEFDFLQSICPEAQKKIIVEIDTVLRGQPLDETSASQLT